MYHIMLVKKVFLLVVLGLLFTTFLSACDVGQMPSGCTDTDYHCLAKQDAFNSGIPANNYETQIQVESGFQPSVVSPAGAIGIAQIMPATAQEWNVDPWNPDESLNVAAQHMAWYQNHYGAFDKALGAYNAGMSRVDWAIQNCSYWLYCMPLETQHYVNIIMGY